MATTKRALPRRTRLPGEFQCRDATNSAIGAVTIVNEESSVFEFTIGNFF